MKLKWWIERCFTFIPCILKASQHWGKFTPILCIYQSSLVLRRVTKNIVHKLLEHKLRKVELLELLLNISQKWREQHIVESALTKAASLSVPKQCKLPDQDVYLQEQRQRNGKLDSPWHEWKGHQSGWMPIKLTLLLQQHMPVCGNSNVKWPQVEGWIKLRTQNSSAFVQYPIRSSSVQSIANTIVGKGAAFTIRTNASGAFLSSLWAPTNERLVWFSNCRWSGDKPVQLFTHYLHKAIPGTAQSFRWQL